MVRIARRLCSNVKITCASRHLGNVMAMTTVAMVLMRNFTCAVRGRWRAGLGVVSSGKIPMLFPWGVWCQRPVGQCWKTGCILLGLLSQFIVWNMGMLDRHSSLSFLAQGLDKNAMSVFPSLQSTLIRVHYIFTAASPHFLATSFLVKN